MPEPILHFLLYLRSQGYTGSGESCTDDPTKVTCPFCRKGPLFSRALAAWKVGLLPETPVEVVKDKYLELGLEYEELP